MDKCLKTSGGPGAVFQSGKAADSGAFVPAAKVTVAARSTGFVLSDMAVMLENGWRTPSLAPSPSWVAYPHVFLPAECGAVTAMMTACPAKEAGLVDGAVDISIRQTAIQWLAETEETAWIYSRLTRVVAQANREAFNFAIAGFDEEAQISRYQDGGFYDWHIDRGGKGPASRFRKLGVSIQLSPPTGYDGGDLELNPDGHVVTAPRTQGTAVVFPAYMLHRVTPVTSGVRHSLVIWAHGPDFT